MKQFCYNYNITLIYFYFSKINGFTFFTRPIKLKEIIIFHLPRTQRRHIVSNSQLTSQAQHRSISCSRSCGYVHYSFKAMQVTARICENEKQNRVTREVRESEKRLACVVFVSNCVHVVCLYQPCNIESER